MAKFILTLSFFQVLPGGPERIIRKACADCDPGFRGYPQYFRKQGMFEFNKGIPDNGNNCFDDRIRVEKGKEKVVVYLY